MELDNIRIISITFLYDYKIEQSRIEHKLRSIVIKLRHIGTGKEIVVEWDLDNSNADIILNSNRWILGHLKQVVDFSSDLASVMKQFVIDELMKIVTR